MTFLEIAHAADWPMWGNDAGHGAYTPAALPKTLHRQWTLRLPKQQPAWPETQTKLQFDAAYEPVVADGRMFVSSTVDDSVTAFRVADGKQLWKFHTEGPVRFAPVATATRVYAAGDDGHLYCLNAETGKLLWKVNGGPSKRLILGNKRLISSWPARGGAVLADGVVYFAAGIWPSMGIFIHAVDAETGKILWTNSRMGSLYVVHPHGAPSFGSVVPQGYLTVNGDNLIVPGGRSTPAVLNRKTGKLKFFHFDKRTGHFRVTSRGKYYFVAGTRYGLEKGASFGNADPVVLSGNAAITASGKTISAAEINGKSSRTITKDHRGRIRFQTKFTSKPLWSIQIADGSPSKVFLLAGNRVYTAGNNRIAAFVLPEGKKTDVTRKAEWTAQVDGEVRSLLAADDRLFAVTAGGAIICFGKKTDSPAVTITPATGADDTDSSRTAKNLAAELIHLSKAEAATDDPNREPAWCVVFGAGKVPGLGRQIAEQSNHNVAVFDRDSARIAKARRYNIPSGRQKTIATAHLGDLASTGLPPYLASLIVVEYTDSAGFDISAEQLRKLFHPLRPYGGVACVRLSDAEHKKFAAAAERAQLANAQITRSNGWTLLRRVGALPKSAGWTHQYADGSNSVVSRDQLVKAPLGVLWFGGPPNDKILPRHGHGPSPQVAGGRLFIEGPDIIRAVDVYTGRLLWETELKGIGTYYNVTRHFAGAGEIGSNYVSRADAVYVVYGTRILELEAATGKLKKEFVLPRSADGNRPNWGHIAVEGDYLVATSTPVTVGGVVSVSRKASKGIPKGFRPVIKSGAKWKYLAGGKVKAGWNALAYPDAGWKIGAAGFGYGDGDDRTVLDMRGKFSTVYIRKTFDGKSLASAGAMALMVNYDDGFIAYLNGKEIARANVSGNGLKTKASGSHEAQGYERFDIRDFRKHLKPGQNVIAFEGHNRGSTSSDFSLDPYMIVKDGGAVASKSPAKKKAARSATDVASAFRPVPYSSASRRLVVFNRKSGKLLWKREAEYNFRHNCIAVAAGKVFCIDGLSPAKIDALKRRGINAGERAKLLAIDLETGRDKWTATKGVVGTFLNYSRQHDVLLQAGSAYRDRARDEISRGMTAYRGSDGKVIWSAPEIVYNGPCLLWRDKIITNGAGGFQLELLTGKKTDWTYSRMYGCNTAVGSEHLLTFRSGAAGFCDLTGDSGTGNIGGFRSSCTANLIAADGVLNAPDYTRTCSCAYQNQTSLALVHMPGNEYWTFNRRDMPAADARRTGINLGAPGDRRSRAGTLWIDVPSVGGPSPELAVNVEPRDAIRWFQRHSSAIQSGPLKWVAASGGEGIGRVTIDPGVSVDDAPSLTVRLVFAEHTSAKPGERVFSVAIRGKTVLNGLDVVKMASGANRTLVREFRIANSGKPLEIALTPSADSKRPPVLCGVEIVPATK